MRKGTCSSSVLARDVIRIAISSSLSIIWSVRRRRNRRLTRRLRACGGTPADANEREQSGEAPNHSPAMSHRNTLPFRNSRREVGTTLKVILEDTQAMRRREVRRQRRAASRFVRNGSASLSFDSFF